MQEKKANVEFMKWGIFWQLSKAQWKWRFLFLFETTSLSKSRENKIIGDSYILHDLKV